MSRADAAHQFPCVGRLRLMNPNRRTTPLTIGLYLNAGLLALIAVALLSKPSAPQFLPVAMGQQGLPPQQQPIAGGAGIFIMPAQFANNLWGCYLMDVDAQTLCAYMYYPGERQLRLAAARSFKYDRHLGNYNTANPSPNEVKELVEKEQAGARGLQPKPPTTPTPGATP